MPSEPVVVDWSTAEVDAFMALEWPPHNDAVGIRWDEHWVVLACRVDGEVVGAARGKIVGGVGELKQLLVKKERIPRGIGLTADRCIRAALRRGRVPQTAARDGRVSGAPVLRAVRVCGRGDSRERPLRAGHVRHGEVSSP